jgi:hypothetical protein
MDYNNCTTELLVSIFELLKCVDHLACRLVCKNWLNVINKYFFWKEISFKRTDIDIIDWLENNTNSLSNVDHVKKMILLVPKKHADIIATLIKYLPNNYAEDVSFACCIIRKLSESGMIDLLEEVTATVEKNHNGIVPANKYNIFKGLCKNPRNIRHVISSYKLSDARFLRLKLKSMIMIMMASSSLTAEDIDDMIYSLHGYGKFYNKLVSILSDVLYLRTNEDIENIISKFRFKYGDLRSSLYINGLFMYVKKYVVESGSLYINRLIRLMKMGMLFVGNNVIRDSDMENLCRLIYILVKKGSWKRFLLWNINYNSKVLSRFQPDSYCNKNRCIIICLLANRRSDKFYIIINRLRMGSYSYQSHIIDHLTVDDNVICRLSSLNLIKLMLNLHSLGFAVALDLLIDHIADNYPKIVTCKKLFNSCYCNNYKNCMIAETHIYQNL